MVYLPKYLQIAESLKKQLTAGTLRVGEMLPGEIQLAAEQGVSRRTMRAALQVLEDDGFVSRRKGAGTVIAPVNMHRKRMHADVAIVVEAHPQSEHNFDFLLDHGQLASGIMRGLAVKGHWLRYIPWDFKNGYYTTDEVFRKGIDGYVFPELSDNETEFLTEVVRRRIPHIVYEGSVAIPGLNFIAADEYEAGRAMVEMLAGQGEQELAVVVGVLKTPFRNTANRRRYEGIKAGLAAAEIRIPEARFKVFDTGSDAMPSHYHELLAAEIRRMLTGKRPPRVMILSSLLVADAFISVIRELGLRCPQDVRGLTFFGACGWPSIRNGRAVRALEHFDCDNAAWVKAGIDLLDEWLNDPAYHPGRHLVPCVYHRGGAEL